MIFTTFFHNLFGNQKLYFLSDVKICDGVEKVGKVVTLHFRVINAFGGNRV